MFQSYDFLLWVAAFGLATTLSGCGSPTSQDKQKPAAATDSKAQDKPAAAGEQTGHGDHADHNAHSDASPADALKGLAELSADDRAAAEKQRVCPVSGEVLGSQGKPVKVTVKGKTVYLCCADCEEAIKKDPDKYLAKLKDAQ
jgi:YHS domain-containing protein